MAIYLQDKHSIRDGMDYVRYAEARGFEAVWQAESRLARDAVTAMAAFAAVTDRIKVGSGVINTWTRNAALVAQTMATLDELAPGRILCGLGAWWDPLASNVGIDRSRPLKAMREYVEAIRRLLRMEAVTYPGEFVRLKDARIDIVHGNSGPRRVPIYVGATGMQMMEVAGEVADGVLLNYMVSPVYNREAMTHLEAGARKAGRTLTQVDRPQLVVCSVDRNRARALEPARELLTQYLGQQPHIMKASGVDPDLIKKINDEVGWPATPERIRHAMRHVPDSVVQQVAAAGTPDECRAKVAEYEAAGCTCPVLYPLGEDVRLMIDVFSE